MSIKKVTAIINEMQQGELEKALESHGVTGFSVHSIKGRGEYCNTYSNNHLICHSQFDIYTSDEHAEKVAQLIMHTTNAGASSKGLVAISSVDKFYWIRNQQASTAEEFNYFENDYA